MAQELENKAAAEEVSAAESVPPEISEREPESVPVNEADNGSDNNKESLSEKKKREKEKVDYLEIMKDGLWKKNPTLVQLLGMCSTLAVTTSLLNGIALGLCTTVVLIFSNIFISLVRRVIPRQIRIASYIVIISSFVTVVEFIMKAYFHELNKSLGIFIPLIVVNCVILARAESFASRNSVLPSAADGLFMGLGFTLALALMGGVRELWGNGTVLGIQIMPSGYVPTLLFITPAGAFMTLGLIIAVCSVFNKNKEK